MATSAWKVAGTGSGWTNSGNISANDDSFATTSMGAGASSPILTAKNFGFTTADVPSGSLITGLEFRVNWRRLSGYGIAVNIATIRFSWGGSDGDDKDTTVPAISNTKTSFVLGSTTDTWNASSLSAPGQDTEVRSAEFGLSFRVMNTDAKYSADVGVDSVEMRVTFTPPAAAPTVSNNSASAEQGVGGTVQMSATQSPTSWSLPGSPPTGVSINSSGLVTWTSDTPAAVHSITVRATNATGNGDGTLTLTITEPPPPPATGPSTTKLGGMIHMLRRGAR